MAEIFFSKENLPLLLGIAAGVLLIIIGVVTVWVKRSSDNKIMEGPIARRARLFSRLMPKGDFRSRVSPSSSTDYQLQKDDVPAVKSTELANV
jgi:hypothetical protein